MKGRNTDLEYDIPKNLADGLERYFDHGIRTGGFLRACLENDFVEAMARSAFLGGNQLKAIGLYLSYEAPPLSWGSQAHVDAWIAKGRAHVLTRASVDVSAERFRIGYLTSEHLPDGPGAQHLPKPGDDETKR